MTESEVQQLIDGNTPTIPDTSKIIESALEPLMPLLTIVIIIGIILSVVVVIYYIVSIIQKQRQHKAILRIDQNLQRLVDAKFPEPKIESLAE